MPEPLTFQPLAEVAASRAPAPEAAPRTAIFSWREVAANPKFQQADTGKRLQVLDKWAESIQQNRDAIPAFDPGLFYDKVQAQRAAIAEAKTGRETAKEVAKSLPRSLWEFISGGVMLAGEHMDMSGMATGKKRETPMTEAMMGKISTFAEQKVANDGDATLALRAMADEFRDAVGREQFPANPEQAREWFAGWEDKLRAQSRKAYPGLIAGQEIAGDRMSQRRSLTAYEPNLQGIAAFISTKNPAYIEQVIDRVTASPARAMTRDQIERETKGMPEWRQRAFETGSDPVNLLVTVGSIGVGAALGGVAKAGGSAAARLAKGTAAVVADAEMNAQAAKISAWLENGRASDAELDEAAKQGRFAAYLFAGLGYGARKLANRKAKPPAEAPTAPPPPPEVGIPATRAASPSGTVQGWEPPGSEPVDLPGAPTPRERMTAALESLPQAGPLAEASPARPDRTPLPRTLDPVPESPATLIEQADRARMGRKPAMLITNGEEVPNNMPESYQSVKVAEGTVFYDPQVFDADGIKDAAAANQLGDVLGYGVPNKAADADRAVVQRAADGTEVNAVAVAPDQIPAATQALDAAAVPGDTIAVEPLQQVVEERMEATSPEVSNDTKARRPPRPGIRMLEQGTGDIWTFLEENPIRIPRPAEVRKLHRRGIKGGEYDIKWAEGVPPRYMAAFSQDGRAVDLVAQDAYSRGLIGDPSMEALKRRMDEDLDYRLRIKKQNAKREDGYKANMLFGRDATPTKGQLTVDPATLETGDEIVLANGKKMKVEHTDKDWIYFGNPEHYGDRQVQWPLATHIGADSVTRQKRPPAVNADRSPEAQAARFMDASRSDKGGKLPVPVSALQVGDTVTIDGTPAKVTSVEEDIFLGSSDGPVTIDDGRRFGVQTLKGDDMIYAEKVDRPKGTPKLDRYRADAAASALEAHKARTQREIPKQVAKLLDAEEYRASTGGEAGAKAAASHAGASLGPGASSAAEWRPHKATLRLANDPRLTPRTRELLQEGQDYRILGRAENLQEARELVEKAGGLRAASEAMDDADVPGRVKVVIAEAAIRKLDSERGLATTATEIDALDDIVDEIARKLNRVNLEAGRTVEANKHVSMLTPESILSELAEQVEIRQQQGRASPLADAIPTRPDGKPLMAADILAAMPKELQTKVRDLTARIRQAPEGIYKADLNRQLLAEIARWKGVDLLALGEEYWMANLLSGLNTQGVNVWGNGTNLMLRTMITALRERDTVTVGKMLEGMVQGAKEGGRDFIRAWQGKDIVKWQEKYGMHDAALENFSKMFDGRTDLKARAARAFTLGKYVFRALGGMDAFFWRTAYEGRVTLAATRHARSLDPKMQGTNLAHYLSEVLHNGQSETAAALAQATKEASGLKLKVTKRDIEARAWEILDARRPDFMRAEGRRYADLATFTNQPEGSMGEVAGLLNRAVEKLQVSTPLGALRPAKFVFPFVNTIANVASAAMDFTPIGVWRGLSGRHIFGADPVKFSAIEARERLYAGVLGTTVAGLAYALAGSGDPENPAFEIYGEGPTDPEKRRQMRNAGWMPFSIKLGNNYFSYKESPMGLMLAVTGGMRDLESFSGKYAKEDAMARAFYVLGVVPAAISQQGVLQGLEGLSGLLSGQPGRLRRFAEGTAKGFIPAVGLMRDIGRVFDPTVVDARTLHGAILKDVPVIRRELNQPALNAFGEPVRTIGLGRIPVVSRIASSRVEDKDIEFLANHGLWLPGHDDIVNVGAGLETKGERAYIARLVESRAQKMGRLQAGVLTDAETRDYLRRQGVWLRQGIKWMRQRNANGIGPKDKEGMQDEVRCISAIARKAAMRELLGLPQRATQSRK